MRRRKISFSHFLLLLAVLPLGSSAIDRSLAYPEQAPDAAGIIRQVYYVNHTLAVDQLEMGNKKQPVVLVTQTADSKPRFHTILRYLNNNYDEPKLVSRDLVIIQSGNMKGTGILVNNYRNEEPSDYSIWMPTLRKVRRFGQPEQNDIWNRSVFTYGDIYLRKPKDETHELLGKETFSDCLDVLKLKNHSVPAAYPALPQASCVSKGKSVYRIKSTTLFSDWWYDYRESLVDTNNFADYRISFYKDGELVKRIDKAWDSMGLDDPRALFAHYWYAHIPQTDQNAMIYIEPGSVRWNTDHKPGLWSEKTLRKIKR
jgi:hypothetical protein